MDYLNVGANGFGQVGDEHYYAKNRVEMKHLLELITDKFPIPEKLQMLCRFAVKAFLHDFGTYHEIVLHFDDIAIGDGYDEDEDDDEEVIFLTQEEILFIKDNAIPCVEYPKKLHDIFWDWFHEVEAFNMETDEITESIKIKYLATLDITKGEHLSISPKRKAS